jgi:hypothetical protein
MARLKGKKISSAYLSPKHMEPQPKPKKLDAKQKWDRDMERAATKMYFDQYKKRKK